MQPGPMPAEDRGHVRASDPGRAGQDQGVGPVVGSPAGARQQNPLRAPPGKSGLGLDGYPADGCVNYVLGRLSETKLSVVTIHKVPGFFDNRNLPPGARMQDYNMRTIH